MRFHEPSYNATHMPKKIPSARGHATKSYPQKKNLCFACGRDNPDGMRLKFTQDSGNENRSEFQPELVLSP